MEAHARHARTTSNADTHAHMDEAAQCRQRLRAMHVVEPAIHAATVAQLSLCDGQSALHAKE